MPAGARLAERLRGVWGQGDEETIRRENKYLHKISWKFLLGIRNNGRTQLLEKGAANRRQDAWPCRDSCAPGAAAGNGS